jgi:hypothetical protein
MVCLDNRPIMSSNEEIEAGDEFYGDKPGGNKRKRTH